MKLAVLGGGNGAFAFSAHLSSMGHEVNLFEIPEYADTIREVKKTGGIELEANKEINLPLSVKEGFQKLNKITTEISEAVKGVEIIMIVIPALAQRRFFKILIPYLEEGQTIFMSPGNLFSSIELAHMIGSDRIKKQITIAESPTLLYGAVKTGPNKVIVKCVKENFGVSTFPATANDEFMVLMKEIYPSLLKKATNVIETGLNNPNTMHHAPIMLMNAGRIESTNSEFLFYSEGTTPSIAKVIDAMNRERLALGKALNLDLLHMADLLTDWYYSQGFERGWSTLEVLQKNPIYSRIAPKTMQYRFLMEDVPFGLVPMASLAELAGTPNEVMKMMIGLTNLVNEVNYYRVGRTLSGLSLADLTVDELIKYVTYGEEIRNIWRYEL